MAAEEEDGRYGVLEEGRRDGDGEGDLLY